jgi:hypothetical protein
MENLLALCVWTIVGVAFSETQTFGFGENVLKLLEKEKAAFKRGGMDVDAVIATVRSLLEVAVTANAQQHDLMRQAKAGTAHSDAMTKRLYVASSGALDMAIAAVEKNSPAAKEIQRLRSRASRPPAGVEAAVRTPIIKP